MGGYVLDIDVDYVVREYLAGKSVLNLARELGVSRAAIVRRLRDVGVTPRSRGDASQLAWDRRTPEARARVYASAHAACGGRVRSQEELARQASRREERQLGISAYERALAALLCDRHLSVIHQRAIGPYNCDLAVHPVAVEIFGGYWHFSGRHARRAPQRTRYLMDHGWDVLMVLITDAWPVAPCTADYVVAYVHERRSDPAAVRQYRMIRGTGELLVRGSAKDNQITLVTPYSRGQWPRRRGDQRVAG